MNLAHFGRPPYSTLYYSNHSHTQHSNHLEPLEKIESPQLASRALGANKDYINSRQELGNDCQKPGYNRQKPAITSLRFAGFKLKNTSVCSV